MKKIFALLIFLVVVCVAGAILAWGMSAQIVSHFIGKQLEVSASIQSFNFSSKRVAINGLWIGNPPKSRTNTSFTAQTLTIDSTYSQVLGDPLIIDEIDLENIFVGVEFFDAGGKDNNWSRMLKETKEEKSKKGYLIRTLILTNLTVQVTKPDGSVKRYPTIPRMEFHNISSETGLPLSQIEKAIFQLVLKDLFQKLDLNQILDTINAIKGGSPVKIPKLF